jgi:hypothetical protein
MSKELAKMNLIAIVQKFPKEDIEYIQDYVGFMENEIEELKKKLMTATKMESKQIQENTFVGIDCFINENQLLKNKIDKAIELLNHQIEILESKDMLHNGEDELLRMLKGSD